MGPLPIHCPVARLLRLRARSRRTNRALPYTAFIRYGTFSAPQRASGCTHIRSARVLLSASYAVAYFHAAAPFTSLPTAAWTMGVLLCRQGLDNIRPAEARPPATGRTNTCSTRICVISAVFLCSPSPSPGSPPSSPALCSTEASSEPVSSPSCHHRYTSTHTPKSPV